MKSLSKVRTGYGISLHEQKVWPDSPEHLRWLLASCSPEYKQQFWKTFPHDDVFAQDWEVIAILEGINADSPLLALATMLAEAIRNQYAIELTAAIDFADSDNVVLVMPDDDPRRRTCRNELLNAVLKQYLNMLSGRNRYQPGYISWHVEVQYKRHFIVDTPIGKISVRAKSDDVNDNDYPGVYIDFISAETGEEVPLGCVEFSPDAFTIATDIYHTEENVERVFHNVLPGKELATAKHLISDFLKKEYCGDADEDFHDLSHIALTWGAVDEQEQVEVNVYADLEKFCMKTYLTAAGHDAVLVSTNSYPDLESLICHELDTLDYDSMCIILDNEWVEFSKDTGTQQWLLQQYPVGTTHHFECFNDSHDGVVKGLTESGRIIVEQADGTIVNLLYSGEYFSNLED